MYCKDPPSGFYINIEYSLVPDTNKREHSTITFAATGTDGETGRERLAYRGRKKMLCLLLLFSPRSSTRLRFCVGRRQSTRRRAEKKVKGSCFIFLQGSWTRARERETASVVSNSFVEDADSDARLARAEAPRRGF